MSLKKRNILRKKLLGPCWMRNRGIISREMERMTSRLDRVYSLGEMNKKKKKIAK